MRSKKTASLVTAMPKLAFGGGGRLDVLFGETDVVQFVHFLGDDEVFAGVARQGDAGDPLAVEAGGHGRDEFREDELFLREGGQDAVDEKLAGDAGEGRGVDGGHRFLQGLAAAGIEVLLNETVADRIAVAAEDRIRGQVAEREVGGLDAAGLAAAAGVEGLLQIAQVRDSKTACRPRVWTPSGAARGRSLVR